MTRDQYVFQDPRAQYPVLEALERRQPEPGLDRELAGIQLRVGGDAQRDRRIADAVIPRSDDGAEDA